MMDDEQDIRDTLDEDSVATAGQAPSAPEDADEADSEKPPEPAEPGEAEPGEDEQGSEQEAAKRSGWSFLQETVVLFAIALTIALLIKTFVVQPFYIPSGSMEDTLLIGDKILVNKLVYHLRPIERGDIVVFNGTGSWEPPAPAAGQSHSELARIYDDTLGKLVTSIKSLFGTPVGQTDYVKRVIGLPGDHVRCCTAQGLVTVNGIALHEKSYLFPGNRPSQYPFNIVVPPGRLWVMGDHRQDSSDSRLHDCAYKDPDTSCMPYDRDGTIPINKVIGRVFLIVWPPSRFRSLPIPSTFDQPGLNRPAGDSAASAPAAASAARALADGVPVRPSPPYVPLAAGLVAAVPLTVLQRRVRTRRRLRHRRHRPTDQAIR